MSKTMKWLQKCFVTIPLTILTIKTVEAQTSAFDLDLYENVLDTEQCYKQLTHIRNDAEFLRTRFMDASWRVPRNILKGNTRDLGNYFTCLEISEEVSNMHIAGKYCTIQIPSDQEFEIPTIPEDWNITWPEIPPSEPMLKLPFNELVLSRSYSNKFEIEMRRYQRARQFVRHMTGANPDEDILSRTSADSAFSGMTFELAVCIPKVCTTRQALDFFTNNSTETMTYTEQFCRLPNDKTWAPVDTVVAVLLSIFGVFIILSTTYDVRHTVILEKDPKHANKIYQSFSLYTNTRNLFIFPSGPNVVTCLDGIRSFAMLWVIVGHTFIVQLSFISENPIDMINFIPKFSSLWITSATITVDTFFLISGILIVYTTASKVSRRSLIRNLPLFYLNRLLRMFPVLAFTVLMVTSFLHRTADGPYFHVMAGWVNTCRSKWWTTLLYVQNFVNPQNICMAHTWYLAIDMQLYILSPIVLFWVLGPSKRSSWCALAAALITILIASSVYNFMNDFQSAVVSLSRPFDGEKYTNGYYYHTLPRASPFFVGMIFGYLLHVFKGKTVKIPMVQVLLYWVLAISSTTFVVVIHYWNVQWDWDNQFLDNVINSYKRPLWAASIGWIIFACHKGYGGPINWLLSLYVFKILGRLSYAMYILHFPLQYLLISTTLTPIYFSVHHSIYQFLVDFSLSFIAAFLVTIVIDFPFTNLIKIALEGKRQRPQSTEKPSLAKEEHKLDFKSNSFKEAFKKNTSV